MGEVVRRGRRGFRAEGNGSDVQADHGRKHEPEQEDQHQRDAAVVGGDVLRMRAAPRSENRFRRVMAHLGSDQPSPAGRG